MSNTRGTLIRLTWTTHKKLVKVVSRVEQDDELNPAGKRMVQAKVIDLALDTLIEKMDSDRKK